jgi:hypothetical protein
MGNSIINLRQKDDLASILPAGIHPDEQELIPTGASDSAKQGEFSLGIIHATR